MVVVCWSRIGRVAVSLATDIARVAVSLMARVRRVRGWSSGVASGGVGALSVSLSVGSSVDAWLSCAGSVTASVSDEVWASSWDEVTWVDCVVSSAALACARSGDSDVTRSDRAASALAVATMARVRRGRSRGINFSFN